MPHSHLSRNAWISALAAFVLSWSTVSTNAAVVIDPGYDLTRTQTAYFQTGSGLIPFTGVPLNTFDFGGLVGVQNVGETDTIIQRLSGGVLTNPGDSFTTTIVISAINLMSTDGSNLYATTDGTGTGTMTITYDGTTGGTWTNDFNVPIDIHSGSFGGPVILSVTKHFVGNGLWSTTPGNAPVQIIIPGVNDDSFYLSGPAFHDAGGGTVHVVVDINSIPEPNSLVMVSCAAIAGVFVLRRSRIRRQ